MVPATDTTDDHVGPHPSFIEVAKPYIFEPQIQHSLLMIAMQEAREDAVRLKGVEWIDGVRRSLQLPVRTFNTAVIYYHKFRLLHADTSYIYADAAAAALFCACKIEDTLKKSREVLCASYNLKLPASEQLSPDDPRVEAHSKAVIGLERLMLEAAGFDFRGRQPNKLVIKLSKKYGLDRDVVGRTAYNMCIDMYRTFAPLKQTSSTIAFACVELAMRLHELDVERITPPAVPYAKWHITRAEVMESMRDLLDLYTLQRGATPIGSAHPVETFNLIGINLNQEPSTESSEAPKRTSSEANKPTNGVKRNGVPPIRPATPATPGTTSPAQNPQSAIGIRGQNGTVRFMLDQERAKKETDTVEPYFREEMEEYEVEVPENEPVSRQIWKKKVKRTSMDGKDPNRVPLGKRRLWGDGDGGGGEGEGWKKQRMDANDV